MGSVALEPASRRSYAELAAIFNAGYEGYFTPFTLDEAAFRSMSTMWDDDLEASRVVLVDGEPAGICKLAIRGDRGWIAGIGVTPARRGKGLGEELMRGVLAEARERGLREIWLEVLVQNEAAVRLYEKLGFERVRDLEVWSLEPLVAVGNYVPAPVATVHERIRRERRGREPWQRADETIANLENVDALESEHGAMLFRRAGARASLLQAVATDEGAARELLGTLPADVASLSWLNGPEGDPLNDAIRSLGGTLAHRQHELALRL
jgi:ribosomal protein S18 acetylase RimI-like enzyme